jgi:predicted PurR-regulated permease PerM
MDHDLTIMIYGAIMGVVGSVLSSIVAALFQLWLARREDERKRSEDRSRQLRQIHLPTDEDVIKINAGRDHEETPEGQRKTAEAGSLALSAFVGGLMVYKTHDPMLGFAFTFMLSFLLTKHVTRAFMG